MSDLLFRNYDSESVNGAQSNAGSSADILDFIKPPIGRHPRQNEADADETNTIDGAEFADLQELMDQPEPVTGPSSSYAELSETACNYCGIDSNECMVKCNTCDKWFCNSKSEATSSHIVTHMVLSRHTSVSLHEDSGLGDTTLECYNCGKQNVFNLGFISAKQDQVVVMLCRLPCSQLKDSNWDSSNWKPLIEERQFLSWIASVPTEDDLINARMINHQQIIKLENEWRLNRNTNIDDLNMGSKETEGEDVLPTVLRYNDAFQYQRSFAPLIQLECDYDKSLKESQALEHILVKWGLGLNNRHLASFTLAAYETSNIKVAVGDEIILRANQGLVHRSWEGKGVIIRLPNAYQEEFTLELYNDRNSPPPTDAVTEFTAEFVWKGSSYDIMQEALKTFATDEKSVSSYIYHKILGHEVKPIEFDVELPKKLSVPKFTELNISQLNAVKTVLRRPLSLIQGPPGTGKTVTSATIIYHLNALNKGQKILVCAPSNIAVDHLAEKLDSLGLNVVRLTAKYRQEVENSVQHLSLHKQVSVSAKGPLKKLLQLKEELGELNEADSRQFKKLMREKEAKLLDKADIICCTCVAAGDYRLKNYKFRSVLIDESTQAAEPEMLIPIVKGSKQVILVGDHQQLGPVILDRKASDAGLRQSLFERLIILDHVPIRLEVQYRMNPILSEFPSNMFYEGSLQDGVTIEDRLIADSTFPWPIADTPMMFWGNYGKEEISGSGSSFLNRVEAMNVEKLVTRLFKDGVRPEQIGVITPYEGQRAFIIQYMTMNCTLFEKKDEYLEIEVTSVDAFQGREKDFIILSCVRANESQSIGFLKDPRRLNVAITRAKYGLIILGNPRALGKNKLWNHLLVHFREQGVLVDGPLENLQLSMTQLDHNPNRNRRPNMGGILKGQLAESTQFNDSRMNSAIGSTTGTANDNWPELNKPQINNSFYSKLNKLNEAYDNSNKQPAVNNDDIKSITSSFAAGFNLG